MVQKLYCATYIQALVTVTCCFTQEEREAWRKKGQEVMIYREWYFDILTVSFVDDSVSQNFPLLLQSLHLCVIFCMVYHQEASFLHQAPANSLERWLSFIIDQLGGSPLYEEVDASNVLPAVSDFVTITLLRNIPKSCTGACNHVAENLPTGS